MPISPERQNHALLRTIFDTVMATPRDDCIRFKNATRYYRVQIPGVGQESAHVLICTWRHGSRPGSARTVAAAHSCFHPWCVNPWHLFWESYSDNNTRDRRLAGTYPEGERHPRARWTWAQVEEMRAAYASGETQVSIARRYNTRQGAINDIIRERTWRRSHLS